MNDTPLTIVGNLVEDPRSTATANGRVVKFRLASSSRRFDPQQQAWVPKNDIFIGIDCWGQLADNVMVSLHKGDPVVVQGELRLDEWDTDEGRRSAFKVKAYAVGPDLAKGRAAFERTTRMVVPPPLTEDGAVPDLVDDHAHDPARGTDPDFDDDRAERDRAGAVLEAALA
ncbi:single-stranded DNA-binding protein [Klenkia sp. LSe6-5]|uniref:Single-stranded DNA-binding protein n=1 Tax=Klenkia sesuvii TaxID=3103137 RepID=A0ABU8DYG9_9ACTN